MSTVQSICPVRSQPVWRKEFAFMGQILSIESLSLLLREAETKMAELLFLKMYPFALKYFLKRGLSYLHVLCCCEVKNLTSFVSAEKHIVASANS